MYEDDDQMLPGFSLCVKQDTKGRWWLCEYYGRKVCDGVHHYFQNPVAEAVQRADKKMAAV